MKEKLRIKDRSFIYRYPRFSVASLTTAGLLIFFSKPLYDLFIAEHHIDVDELMRTHKSKFSKS